MLTAIPARPTTPANWAAPVCVKRAEHPLQNVMTARTGREVLAVYLVLAESTG